MADRRIVEVMIGRAKIRPDADGKMRLHLDPTDAAEVAEAMVATERQTWISLIMQAAAQDEAIWTVLDEHMPASFSRPRPSPEQ